jgi:hypothetical protein
MLKTQDIKIIWMDATCPDRAMVPAKCVTRGWFSRKMPTTPVIRWP